MSRSARVGEHRTEVDATVDGRLAKGVRARSALIEATLAIIERDGIAGVTHRAATRQAGLPATSAAYHFTSISDLLEQSLLHADGLAAEELARCADAENPIAAFADWLVSGCTKDRTRVIAEYELFLYAVRMPAMRPSARRWLDDLGALVETWTDSPRAARTICAYVDGLVLQALVAGERPDPADIESTIRALASIGDPPGS
jgi:TetR/AcrR family transcriptional regulator, regulator of biofilm formation and stress response